MCVRVCVRAWAQVRLGVGISLLQPGLLDVLRANAMIESVGLATGERLKYRPPFGVRNRGSLAHMLSRAYPGSGEAEGVLRSELKAEETYDDVDVDIDELLAQGRAVKVERTDKKDRDFVLFAAPAGRPASEEVRALWRAERVPQGPALHEALLKNNLRTEAELKARAERKAAARKRAQELAAQPKRARGGQVRTWANTHLGDAAQLEELTSRGVPKR